MSGKIIVIQPNGKEDVIPVERAPSLEKLQELCGGYIQAIPHFITYQGQPCKAYGDEDGKMKRASVNELASVHWYGCPNGVGPNDDVLVGNIVVLLGDARRGW